MKRPRRSSIESVEVVDKKRYRNSTLDSTKVLGSRSVPWHAFENCLDTWLAANQERHIAGLLGMPVPRLSAKLEQFSGVESRVSEKLEQLSGIEGRIVTMLEKLSGAEAYIYRGLQQIGSELGDSREKLRGDVGGAIPGCTGCRGQSG